MELRVWKYPKLTVKTTTNLEKKTLWDTELKSGQVWQRKPFVSFFCNLKNSEVARNYKTMLHVTAVHCLRSLEKHFRCVTLSSDLYPCTFVGMGSFFFFYQQLHRWTSGLPVGGGLRIKTSTGAVRGQRGPMWGLEGPQQGHEGSYFSRSGSQRGTKGGLEKRLERMGSSLKRTHACTHFNEKQ